MISFTYLSFTSDFWEPLFVNSCDSCSRAIVEGTSLHLLSLLSDMYCSRSSPQNELSSLPSKKLKTPVYILYSFQLKDRVDVNKTHVISEFFHWLSNSLQHEFENQWKAPRSGFYLHLLYPLVERSIGRPICRWENTDLQPREKPGEECAYYYKYCIIYQSGREGK